MIGTTRGGLLTEKWVWTAVSMGSNLGDRMRNLTRAVGAIVRQLPQKNMRLSSVYETSPVDCPQGGPFLNAVVRFQTSLTPSKLLSALQRIEARLGRTRSVPNAPRTIDLDILLYGDQRVQRSDLRIPHPRLHERLFALVPLAEIDFPHEHPEKQATVASLCAHLQETSDVNAVIQLSQSQWPNGLLG